MADDRRATPDEMADAARRMSQARDGDQIGEARKLPSVEAAIQLKRALERKDRAKARLLNIDSLSDLQERALDYVEAADRAKLAGHVVGNEARLNMQPVHSIGDSIIERG